MSYPHILRQSYILVIRNPVFWLFGFVLLGGFNLYLVNFFSVMPNSQWQQWPNAFDAMFSSPAVGMLAVMLGAIAVFVILNLIKVIFVVVAHSFLHSSVKPECDLCVRIKRQVESASESGLDKLVEPLPYFSWLTKVILASAVTIGLTLGVTLATNAILGAHEYTNPAAVIINLIFIAAVTCIIGTWNVFTSYFVVLHGFSFQAASSAAIDLLTKHARHVLEFVILLSLIYSFAVLVGNAFIHVWHFGFIGHSTVIVRLVFLIVFGLWFAINNALFNMAFLIFFDHTVKSTPAAAEAQAAASVQ